MQHEKWKFPLEKGKSFSIESCCCVFVIREAEAQEGMEWIESQMIIDFRLHTARQAGMREILYLSMDLGVCVCDKMMCKLLHIQYVFRRFLTFISCFRGLTTLYVSLHLSICLYRWRTWILKCISNYCHSHVKMCFINSHFFVIIIFCIHTRLEENLLISYMRLRINSTSSGCFWEFIKKLLVR